MKNPIGALILVTCISMSACEKFEYGVNEINRQEKDPEVTTQFNIDRLLSLPHKDTLHVVLFGDTQRFYDDVEDLVKAVNALPLLDAVVITGDLTDFSLNREFALINRQFKQLKVPFITVIGNHDCLGNGTKLYEEIYGPLNYSFTWNGIRFVAINTNGREFNYNGTVPDLNWMRNQLTDTSHYWGSIFFSHVPPWDGDFDRTLENGYSSIAREAKNMIFCSHGHSHEYAMEQHYQDSIWYLSTSSPAKRKYSFVTIYPNATNHKKFTCVPVDF